MNTKKKKIAVKFAVELPYNKKFYHVIGEQDFSPTQYHEDSSAAS